SAGIHPPAGQPLTHPLNRKQLSSRAGLRPALFFPRTEPRMRQIADRFPAAHRINLILASLLLLIALFSGGSSQESGVGVLALQFLSLPVLAWAAWQHARGMAAPGPWQWTALAIAILAI